MQKLPNLHRNSSSEAIIWGSVHPTKENILLLNNIDLSNDTAVIEDQPALSVGCSSVSCVAACLSTWFCRPLWSPRVATNCWWQYLNHTGTSKGVQRGVAFRLLPRGQSLVRIQQSQSLPRSILPNVVKLMFGLWYHTQNMFWVNSCLNIGIVTQSDFVTNLQV